MTRCKAARGGARASAVLCGAGKPSVFNPERGGWMGDLQETTRLEVAERDVPEGGRLFPEDRLPGCIHQFTGFLQIYWGEKFINKELLLFGWGCREFWTWKSGKKKETHLGRQWLTTSL